MQNTGGHSDYSIEINIGDSLEIDAEAVIAATAQALVELEVIRSPNLQRDAPLVG
jgi:hypothetical protein